MRCPQEGDQIPKTPAKIHHEIVRSIYCRALCTLAWRLSCLAPCASSTESFLTLGMLFSAAHGVCEGAHTSRIIPSSRDVCAVWRLVSQRRVSPPRDAVVGWELSRSLRLVELPRQLQHLAIVVLCAVTVFFPQSLRAHLLAGAFPARCA